MLPATMQSFALQQAMKYNNVHAYKHFLFSLNHALL